MVIVDDNSIIPKYKKGKKFCSNLGVIDTDAS